MTLLELFNEYKGPNGEFYLKDKKQNDNYVAFLTHAILEFWVAKNYLTLGQLQAARTLVQATRFEPGLFSRQPLQVRDLRANSHDNLTSIAILDWIIELNFPTQRLGLAEEIRSAGYGLWWPTAREGSWWERVKGNLMNYTSNAVLKLAAGEGMNCIEMWSLKRSLLKGSNHNLNRMRIIFLSNHDKTPKSIKRVLVKANHRNNWAQKKDYYKGHPYFEKAFEQNNGRVKP